MAAVGRADNPRRWVRLLAAAGGLAALAALGAAAYLISRPAPLPTAWLRVGHGRPLYNFAATDGSFEVNPDTRVLIYSTLADPAACAQAHGRWLEQGSGIDLQGPERSACAVLDPAGKTIHE